MKCPQCEVAGERSRVYPAGEVVAMGMGANDYYDEDGIYHHHDPNSTNKTYSCSKGHRWGWQYWQRCPADCGYNADKTNPTPLP